MRSTLRTVSRDERQSNKVGNATSKIYGHFLLKTHVSGYYTGKQIIETHKHVARPFNKIRLQYLIL